MFDLYGYLIVLWFFFGIIIKILLIKIKKLLFLLNFLIMIDILYV